MLHPIRKLAREIHRRSVWQVLAGYLVLWLVAHQVVEALTEVLGLPLWTPTMAFVLLAIGLPVVLATAVVQGGLPGLRIVDEVDPNELEGRPPEEVHVIPDAHPLAGIGIFTWRNAVLGGVMAAALLITSVVAYLTMWAFGIGPVGSLAAQGIVAPDDRVIVAGFVNATSEAGLGERVRSLMERELARSTFVDVRAAGIAEEGGTPPGGVSESDVSELVEAAGARLVVDGEVGPTEAGYRVYARIRLADGTVVAGFGRDASGADDLEVAVARLALRLRERLGEPLREIHEDTPSAVTN